MLGVLLAWAWRLPILVVCLPAIFLWDLVTWVVEAATGWNDRNASLAAIIVLMLGAWQIVNDGWVVVVVSSLLVAKIRRLHFLYPFILDVPYLDV